MFNFNQFNESRITNLKDIEHIVEQNDSLKYMDDIIHLFEELNDSGYGVIVTKGYAVLDGTEVRSIVSASQIYSEAISDCGPSAILGAHQKPHRLVECLMVDKKYQIQFSIINEKKILHECFRRINLLSEDITILYEGEHTIDILFT